MSAFRSPLMRWLAALPVAAAACAAQASAALHGHWSGQLDGQPVAVHFDAQGGGTVDGRPIRWRADGNTLWVQDQGELAMYVFEVRGTRLTVAGGALPGPLSLVRATAPRAGAVAPAPAARATGAELVGKWCKSSSFTANAGGGSHSSACFELRADGTYVYGSERSASAYGAGMWGGTSASGGDSGRWSAGPGSITAHSSSGQVTTYRLEKRNHPRNRDPMLCLDGECYVTHWQRAPW